MAQTIALPKNAVESSASYFWLRDDGILYIYYKAKSVHNLEDAVENIQITLEVSGNTPRPLLIDMTNIKHMDRDAREVYKEASAEGKVKAVALVTKSVMSRLVANFFIGFNKPEAPIRLFNNAGDAARWLRKHI